MKIFITGTTGFLGRSLKEHFSNNNEIIEFQRGSSITDSLETAKPNLIIHCAGEIYDPSKMFETNVVMVENILNWIRDNSSVRMIQIGSSAEYGPVSRPTNEQDSIRPQNLYEATKGSATLLCQGYARHYNLDTCVVRIYSGYGAFERPHRLFPRLYRAFFHNEPMRLFDGVHDFIYIDDFIYGIESIINSEWPQGEIVNLGSGIQYRNVDVLKAWESVTQRTAPVEYIDRFNKPHDTNFWCCDLSYARKKYNFNPRFSLEDGIRDMISKLTTLEIE